MTRDSLSGMDSGVQPTFYPFPYGGDIPFSGRLHAVRRALVYVLSIIKTSGDPVMESPQSGKINAFHTA